MDVNAGHSLHRCPSCLHFFFQTALTCLICIFFPFPDMMAKKAMTSYGLEDDPQSLFGHLFHIFYFIRIYHLNKIFCSSHMVLPYSLPFFGCLILNIVFDILNYSGICHTATSKYLFKNRHKTQTKHHIHSNFF